MSRRTRALLVAAAVGASLLFAAAPPASAMCVPGHVSLSPPSVQLPKCDQPPQP